MKGKRLQFLPVLDLQLLYQRYLAQASQDPRGGIFALLISFRRIGIKSTVNGGSVPAAKD